jgi:hypothetical protein
MLAARITTLRKGKCYLVKKKYVKKKEEVYLAIFNIYKLYPLSLLCKVR